MYLGVTDLKDSCAITQTKILTHLRACAPCNTSLLATFVAVCCWRKPYGQCGIFSRHSLQMDQGTPACTTSASFKCSPDIISLTSVCFKLAQNGSLLPLAALTCPSFALTCLGRVYILSTTSCTTVIIMPSLVMLPCVCGISLPISGMRCHMRQVLTQMRIPML
jgi:hypothetical protein